MTAWFIAVLVATLLAWAQYGARRHSPASAVPLALRWLAVLLVVALLLDAPAGRGKPPQPLVALDASASWLKGGDSSAWRAAVALATRPSAERANLFGDSSRVIDGAVRPRDRASLVRPAVDRALAAGRPLVVITDGLIDDPDALSGLPSGSRVEIPASAGFPDVALVRIDVPASVVSGDTVEITITVASGAVRAEGASIELRAGRTTLDSARVEPLTPYSERRVSFRPSLKGMGPTLLTAVARMPGDRESRNDSLLAVIEITRGAAAVFVSTSPNEDSRFALGVLRGALALPTRGYVQVAPGMWKVEGTLAPATAAEVRAALRDAPLAVLHGDTAIFGSPRALGKGALTLWPTNIERGADWYATGAPASPLMGPLSQLPWDSLPPLDVAAVLPAGDWDGLTATRARQTERRTAIVGFEGGRRVVVIGASGFWRWRFRGGASEVAYGALWGTVFDWLAGGRFDARASVPAATSFRAGEKIRWQRGSGRDSSVTVELRRRGDTARVRVPLFFGSAPTTESPALDAGVYEARVPGGASLIAVNASRELLPRQPTVRAGPIGARAAVSHVPRVRDYTWLFVLVVFAMCAEWLLRRRAGLR